MGGGGGYGAGMTAGQAAGGASWGGTGGGGGGLFSASANPASIGIFGRGAISAGGWSNGPWGDGGGSSSGSGTGGLSSIGFRTGGLGYDTSSSGARNPGGGGVTIQVFNGGQPSSFPVQQGMAHSVANFSAPVSRGQGPSYAATQGFSGPNAGQQATNWANAVDNSSAASFKATTQSNPYSQMYSGQVGGKISGPANPYNNNQFLNVSKPTNIFQSLQDTWSSIFSVPKGAGVGLAPGKQLNTQNIGPNKTQNEPDLASFQQHAAPINYAINPLTGKSEPVNPVHDRQLDYVTGDIQGLSPAQQLAGVLNSTVRYGQRLSPEAMAALESASTNVLALSFDAMSEPVAIAVMEEAARQEVALPVTPTAFLKMSPDAVVRILDNPALAPYYRAPFINATKGPLEQATRVIAQNFDIAVRLSTNERETVNFSAMRSDPFSAKDAVAQQLNLLGYSNAIITNPGVEGGSKGYGAVTGITQAVLAAISQSEPGVGQIQSATLESYGITLMSEGNNQYSISLPGPLYGPMGYSAKSYMAISDSAQAFLGESGNPMSGNAQNITAFENARTVGNQEIGPVPKTDPVTGEVYFTLGFRGQTIDLGESRVALGYSKYPNIWSGANDKVANSGTDLSSAYTNIIVSSGWPDALKQFFIKSNTYNNIVNLWESQSPGTPFETWVKTFDWQGYYTANQGSGTSGGSSYRPTGRSAGRRRLRSVSY